MSFPEPQNGANYGQAYPQSGAYDSPNSGYNQPPYQGNQGYNQGPPQQN